MIACLSPVLLYGLLSHPATDIIVSKREFVLGQIAEFQEYPRRSKDQCAELARLHQFSERRLQEIGKELEHLRKIQSREYQLQRLFDRNWRAMRSVEFELYLEEVFTAHGYSVETTKTTGDQGVDLVVSKRSIRIAIQAKGYESSVSNGAIQEAYSGMAHYNCHACAAITNSRFTSGAIALATSTKSELIDEYKFRDFVMGRFDLVDIVFVRTLESDRLPRKDVGEEVSPGVPAKDRFTGATMPDQDDTYMTLEEQLEWLIHAIKKLEPGQRIVVESRLVDGERKLDIQRLEEFEADE